MKCAIITVYNSENCGSFLQAWAMLSAIKRLGHSVCFEPHDFSDHVNSNYNNWKFYIKSFLKLRFNAIRMLRMRRRIFNKAIHALPLGQKAENTECYILGSDTTWDVARNYFLNHYDFFWATQFDNAKIISYAPSIGFAQKEDIEKCTFIRDALSRMAAVSVRDQHSKELLQPYCDQEIEIVCDPTYLLNRADYDAIAKPADLENFLFIYYYGKMPADYKEAIQKFAKAEGLKTVTFGSTNPWCDISLAYDPLLFLSLYAKAEYIITNTFHGTVFATIYEKKFAVIKNNKPKVLDVLDMCAMSHKMTQKAEDISGIFRSDFDYATTRQRIQKEREHGLRFLKEALEEKK